MIRKKEEIDGEIKSTIEEILEAFSRDEFSKELVMSMHRVLVMAENNKVSLDLFRGDIRHYSPSWADRIVENLTKRCEEADIPYDKVIKKIKKLRNKGIGILFDEVFRVAKVNQSSREMLIVMNLFFGELRSSDLCFDDVCRGIDEWAPVWADIAMIEIRKDYEKDIALYGEVISLIRNYS